MYHKFFFFYETHLINVHLCFCHVVFSTIGVCKLRRFDLKKIDNRTQLKQLLYCSVTQTPTHTGIVVVTNHIFLIR